MQSLLSPFHVRLPFTFPLVVRYLLITLPLSGFVLGCWSSITPVAHAATHAAAAPKHAHHATSSQPQLAATPQPGKHRLHPATIGTGAVNGLGILPFYTYITQRLTDTTSLSVNVANGNLVIDVHNLSIAGTGLPLSLDTFYNGQMVVNGHTGIWKLSPWGMVTMISNSDGSVNYTGPSGFTATFTKNSDGSYNDAPGIEATLVKTRTNFTLTFHATGEVYVFGLTGGALQADQDRNGNQVSISAGGFTQTLTDTQGRTTTITYSGGLLRSISDPSGRTVQYSYGSGALLTGITDLAGKTTSFGYNSSQELTSITDPLSQGTSISYGDANRVASITYSNDNKPSQTIDALNTQTNYTYDSNANLTQVQNMGTGETASWAFGDSNNPFFPTDQTDTQGNHLRYFYDSKGNLGAVGVPYLGSTKALYTYAYNSNGTPAKLTDANGTVTSYGYDAKGNQTSMTDPTGTTSYTFDKDNRVLTKTLPGGTQLSYTYDPVGNLLTFTDGGGQVSYGYNQVNELTTLTEPGGAKTTFGYDAAGQRTSTNYPNGVVMIMAYDQAGHLFSIKAVKGTTTLTKFTYSYGSAGLYTGSGDTSGNITTYSYDILNRLTEASVKTLGGTQVNDFKYSYDWVGNLTSSTLGIGATPTTYTYNAANELTASTQGSMNVTYSYDADGNETGASPGLSFIYNTLNQTTSISGNTYSYSGSDQTDRVQAGSTSFINSASGISSQTDASGTTYYTHDSSGRLVDERTPSGVFYYLFDGLGSIVGLTDSNGTLVATCQFDPYGNLASSTGSIANPWRFAGGYLDANTGLYKFGQRYYNSTLGRRSQQDPVRGQLNDPTSLNRYLYVGDDPVNVTDPSGRDCIDAATTGCTRDGGTNDSWVQRWEQFVFFLCGICSRKLRKEMPLRQTARSHPSRRRYEKKAETRSFP